MDPDGIRQLRAERGAQHVTFSEIADHLFDFADRHPEETATVEAIARFLVEVEGIEHDHDLHPDRGLPAP